MALCRFIWRTVGISVVALMLGACSSGANTVSTPDTTVEYGLAGGGWDYTAETPGADIDRLATAVAAWNFISLPLKSRFSETYRVHETRFVDGTAWRLGMPREAAGVKSVPLTWVDVKATASFTEGSLATLQQTIRLDFALNDDSPEVQQTAFGISGITDVIATASFSKAEAERLVRLQKEAWNSWYTGELARPHNGQLAKEVSPEELSVEWTISGYRNDIPFTINFIQLTRVFSDIER